MKMSSKFTCRFCKEHFDQPKGLYKHLQIAHSAGSSRDNRTCPICGVLCSKYEGYRDHLLYIHGQSNEGQQLSFKTLNEFLLWKTELEMRYHCKYVLQSAPKVLSSKEKKYFYQCDGSGSKAKDKKTVVMKSCSSVISVVEGTGAFKVEYWDTHSNHAKTEEIAIQNELEAAISSVEMVNSIADSDDSLDRSEEFTIDTNSSSSPIKKQSFVKSRLTPGVNKLNSSPVASTVSKTKSLQSFKADVARKKTTNTSMLFSLASVACGKGITKKPSNKLSANKNENQSKTASKVSTEIKIEREIGNSISLPAKEKEDSTTLTSVAKTISAKSSTTLASTASKLLSVPGTSKVTTSSAATKVTPSGPQAIAPKPASMKNSGISSLYTSNSVFPNQLVFVNPVGMDQNSNQNAITAGQNIVFSLPLGQNILSTNTAPQSDCHTHVSAESNVKPVENADVSNDESSVGKTTATTKSTTVKTYMGISKSSAATKTSTVKHLLDSSKSLSNGTTVTQTTSASPITLPSSINNAPVLLSSLPVGSTFMSVNNNLIPIASPSGTFLPSSLPPNIVLTPVSSTTISNTQLGPQTTVTSSNGSAPSGIVLPTSLTPNLVLTPVISSTASNSQSASKITFSPCIGSPPGTFLPTSLPPNVVLTPVLSSAQTATKTTNSRTGSSVAKTLQNQLLFSVPSTPITVSSVVKEPVFSSAHTSMKQTSSVMSSSATSLISSVRTPTTSTPKKSKATVAPNTSSSPISARKSIHTSLDVTRDKIPLKNSRTFSQLGSEITVKKVNNATSVSKSPVSTSPVMKKAKKSTSKNFKGTAGLNSTVLSSSTKTVSAVPACTVSTNVVNSQLNLAPISSTPDVTMMPQPMNSGTLIFESSGEIFMLEPIENNTVKNLPQSRSDLETPTIKFDRYVQTAEEFDEDIFTSKLSRKRSAPSNEDDAVMMKVKCYQLEMQYLKSQAECKQLKVELTKERLRNAELSGQKVATNGDEAPGESRNKAREIMQEIEDKFKENKDAEVYTMTKTSVLRNLYEDIEELCLENRDLRKELENYRTHDKFYKNLKRKIFDEEF